MDQLEQKIDALEKKIDKIQHSLNQIRNVFLWTLIISIVLFVLPLIGLVFVIPKFLSLYMSVLQ